MIADKPDGTVLFVNKWLSRSGLDIIGEGALFAHRFERRFTCELTRMHSCI